MSKTEIDGAFLLLSVGEQYYLCEVIDGHNRGERIRIEKSCTEYTDTHQEILDELQKGTVRATVKQDEDYWRVAQPIEGQ